MLETILAISGKPGLYRLVSHGNRSLVVESLDAAKKRMPVFGTDKVISLADISMYTDTEDVSLRQVLTSVKEKEQGQPSRFDYKKASKDELSAYMAEVLPNYDRDRVYSSDIKRLIQWYNLLVECGITDFDESLKETPGDNIADRA